MWNEKLNMSEQKATRENKLQEFCVRYSSYHPFFLNTHACSAVLKKMMSYPFLRFSDGNPNRQKIEATLVSHINGRPSLA